MKDETSIKLISKLNRQTKEGTIVWTIETSRPSSLIGTDVLMNNVYMTTVDNIRIRLYRFLTRSYHDEESYEWMESTRLEMIDLYGKTLYEFPLDIGIHDLLQSVMYLTSGAKDFLEEYLKDETTNNDSF